MKNIGIIGSGAMGSGIAQVAAMADCKVWLFDVNQSALEKAKLSIENSLQKLLEKGKIDDNKKSQIADNLIFTQSINDFLDCELVIEAIVENIDIKKKVFADVEKIVSQTCILASNTSSLSITSIAAACQNPSRVIGIHFFNPPILMALVEVIPALQTAEQISELVTKTITNWGKQVVMAKDTPAFIVNRVARPYYGEAIRILEEGLADMETIDAAMTKLGGFRMGPFELMDFIGHDVNFAVTESVFQAFYFEPRYRPSFTQKRLVEAGYLGRKSGKGFYNYAENTSKNAPNNDILLQKMIFERIIVMLINEAAEALHYGVASMQDLDLAMTKGVNYPKGLLQWADDFGISLVVQHLDMLYNTYHEDRYRCSVLLRKMNGLGKGFYV